MSATKLVLCCLLAVVSAGPPVLNTRKDVEEYRENLKKYIDTVEDDGLTLEERMALNPASNVWENSGKFQGDMLLDEELVEDMVNGFASGRMADIRHGRRWPQNTVVYEFGANEFNLAQQRFIIDCMNLISSRTCVRFRQRNNNDRNWVRITGASSGCYAHVGFLASRQIGTLNLARNTPGYGCLHGIVIIHELFHVMGFHHMHSTYNRYTYVRIHWENIQHGLAHAFYRYGNNVISNLGLPYEYGSCMHYGTHAFSSNGRATLSTTRRYDGVLGQLDYVTGWDLLRVQRHYNCPGAWRAAAAEQARVTAYAAGPDGRLEEKLVEPQPLADELELIDPLDDDQE